MNANKIWESRALYGVISEKYRKCLLIDFPFKEFMTAVRFFEKKSFKQCNKRLVENDSTTIFWPIVSYHLHSRAKTILNRSIHHHGVLINKSTILISACGCFGSNTVYMVRRRIFIFDPGWRTLNVIPTEHSLTKAINVHVHCHGQDRQH